MYEYIKETLTFEWMVLKDIARSPLGKLVFLVPFLPFVIDFLDQVIGTVEFVETIIDKNALSSWFENNRRTLMTMYLGLAIFLITRLIFELTCPKNIKNHDDSDQYIVDILNKMKLSKEVEDHERYELFKKRLRNFKGINTEHKMRASPIRLGLSIGFIISIVLLVFPPLGKFIRISLDYISPF